MSKITKDTKIGVLYGGWSDEREISLQSGSSVYNTLKDAGYSVYLCDLNNNKELGTLEMGVLYSKIPDSIKKEIVDPYISIEHNEARINLRIKDSQEGLRRNELIKKIQYDLENKLNIKKDEFKLAGVLILFNNLLQSLFKSQILTLCFVMVGIFVMFLILFINLTLS